MVESQNERLQSTNVTIRNLEGKLKAAESAASIFDEAGEEDKENQGSSSGNSQHPLEVENESLRRELKEVTDCYQASRKNLAVTQKALENTRAINSKTESEMGILNAQLEETKGELEGQAKHHSDMAALLENKVEAAERKAEGVERHYEEVRKGTEVDGRKKLACFRMSMAVMRIAEGGTSGDCRLREAFFSWAFKSASKRGEEIKEDAEIAAVKDREVARKEVARVKREEERGGESQERGMNPPRIILTYFPIATASEKIEAVKKKATDHMNKIKEEMKKLLTSKDSEIAQLKGLVENLNSKLKVAGDDRETLKGRIAELQVQVKAVDAERGREKREKEDTKRKLEQRCD